MSGPLNGVRVLDMTWALAGPFCTMLLSDLGAEVIKVENPDGGDPSRKNFPFTKEVSTYFLSVNRGKKSVTVNLQHPKGKEIVLSLAKKSDVMVENFRPGVMDRLGLGYQAIREVNPRIVYAACSGFGQKSPYAHRPAYDVIVQGMGGTLSITGEEGGGPARVGFSIGDMGGGIFTALGILAALHESKKSGQGQMVDVAMLDGQIAFLENAFSRFLGTGEVPQRIGTRHPVLTPFQALPTKDGYMVVAVARQDWWEKFCHVLNRGELITDERFKTNPLRTKNHKALEEIIAGVTRTRTTGEWVADMEKADIACGPMNTIPELARDPHTVAREMIAQVMHSKAGPLKVVNSPIKLSRTPVKLERASPELGEHTEEIFINLLGLGKEELARLREEKAI
ncbi:MAG TPA: CaiB/BaiF CoA-transferase family protein [Thermodesulfobacteriota bacterium]|nr:CaiB/BaiF CoA-transferase family protein [Thermodesulfobacteriota bacterium]